MNAERQLVKSLLHIAASQGNLVKVESLVRDGVNVDEVVKEDGTTPLFLAAQLGHLEVVQYLVQQGADKNKATNDGFTPLFSAALKGHLAVVQ